MIVPAKPGPLTLYYPQWIPGEHGPTGPIADLVGLKLTAAGRPLSWQRDLTDMYAFRCEVPAGADSVAGISFKSIPLAAGVTPPHRIDLFGTAPNNLEMSAEMVAGLSQLVVETGALFGARHYDHYNFLVALSDYIAHFGLEHHQSSDNREPERALIDDGIRKVNADLLPHEFVHSWNGKFRAPADLAAPDYQQPVKTDLLWVYEGLTQYLGEVLTVRSGLWTPEQFREHLALSAATLDHRAGRTWRPLEDTAVAAQLLYTSRTEGTSWRRGTDFYEEPVLIWLEADVIIRQQSKGRRSLDDFCRRFFGGQNGGPSVVPYTLDDVVATLSEIVPYDWRGFFLSRLNSTGAHAPLAGIEGSGWRLVYGENPSDFFRTTEQFDRVTDHSFTIGFKLREDGTFADILPDSPAARAGIAPGMRLLGVNGRRWSPGMIRELLKPLKTDGQVLSLLVENNEFYQTYTIDYHDGDKYPDLERDPARPDLLEQILKPRTPRPPTAKAD